VLTRHGPLSDASARRQCGTTLVEVLAALLILSLVVVSTLTMLSQAMQLNATGVDYTALTNRAKDKGEELLSLSYLHPLLEPDVEHTEVLADAPLTVTWRVGEHRVRHPGFTQPDDVLTVTPLTSSVAAGCGNLKVMSITVASRGAAGLGRRSITVTAVKFTARPPGAQEGG